MHPWMAVWIWSLAMSRVWNDALPGDGFMADNENGRLETKSLPVPIIVRANAYLKSDIVNQILPERILDRLADLHWMEREPAMAV